MLPERLVRGGSPTSLDQPISIVQVMRRKESTGTSCGWTLGLVLPRKWRADKRGVTEQEYGTFYPPTAPEQPRRKGKGKGKGLGLATNLRHNLRQANKRLTGMDHGAGNFLRGTGRARRDEYRGNLGIREAKILR